MIFKFQFRFQSDSTIKLFKPPPLPFTPVSAGSWASAQSLFLQNGKNEISIIDRHDAYCASFNIELDCPYFSYRASSGLWAFPPLLRSLLDLPSVCHSAAGLPTGCGIFVLLIDTG